MTKKMIGRLLLFIAITMGCVSCSKEVFIEDESSNEPEAKGTLIVRTRASTETASEAVVSYPVNIYVFDSEEGTCVAVTTIEDEDSPVSLTLLEGTYNVYALAGASAEAYELPDMESATEESVVSLKPGNLHGDLMTAGGTVTLTDGETNTLTLSLSRKVMLLQEVTINNVPSSVTAVSVTIAPLHENLCINGEYTGTDGSQSVVLSKEDDDLKVWKNTDEVYLYAASGKATISIKMTTANGVKSYSYVCPETLAANYKLTIEGTYTAEVGVELKGTLIGVEWAGTQKIVFDFDETGSGTTPGTSPDEPEPPVDPVTPDGVQIVEGETVPKRFAEYKGTIVLSTSEQDDGTTIVKVVTPMQEFNTSIFDYDNQTAIKAAVEALLDKIAVEGIYVWRIPTKEEIISILSNYSEINKTIKAMNLNTTIAPAAPFFYQETDGTISFYSNYDDGSLGSSRLRGVATLLFK